MGQNISRLESYIKLYIYIYIYIYTQSGPKKFIHSLVISIFGISYDSVWMPMVATSNTYIESKIQGHLSYQFCFCINTVVTIIEYYFSCQSVYTLFWVTLYMVKNNSINDFIKVYFLHYFLQRHVSALVMSHLQVD